MSKALIHFLLISLSLAWALGSFGVYSDSHREVALRMIGHQVLLSVGDSTSIVKPIQQEGNRYGIAFEEEFGFHPDDVSYRIDSLIKATSVANHYIVEFVHCDSEQVVHAYERGGPKDILACQGRAQPPACYEIWITFPEMGFERSEEPIAQLDPVSEKDEQESLPMMMLGASLFLIVLVIGFLWWRKGPDESVESECVRIGEYLFDPSRMELVLGEERIELTGKEAQLLSLLSSSANETVERDEILRTVWGDEGSYVGRTLDVFISKLRKKLASDTDVRIVNIRGVGYKLILGQ